MLSPLIKARLTISLEHKNVHELLPDSTFQSVGFVAGILVNTDKGLVSIQDIKVGDKVLSKSENNPNGESNYQKITEAHKFQNKSIHLLRLVESTKDDISTTIEVFATPNHPCWKVDIGWTRADLLRHGDEVILSNGNKAIIFEWSPVLRTADTNIGWVASDLEGLGETGAENGYLINFSNNKISTPFLSLDNWLNEQINYWDYAPNGITWADNYEDRYFISTVYNITVENTHTYFIGEHGVWIRDANCRIYK